MGVEFEGGTLEAHSVLENNGYFSFCIHVSNDYYDNGVVVRFKTVEVTAKGECILNAMQQPWEFISKQIYITPSCSHP